MTATFLIGFILVPRMVFHYLLRSDNVDSLTMLQRLPGV
jgi:hypothetical protein